MIDNISSGSCMQHVFPFVLRSWADNQRFGLKSKSSYAVDAIKRLNVS